MKYKIIALVVASLVIVGGACVWILTRNDKPVKDRDQTTQDAAPSIQLDVPQDGLLLSQDKLRFQVAIRTDDYSVIARVEYLVDGLFVTYSTKPPFTVDIDISKLSIGEHTLQAVAYTMSGKTSKSDVFTFIITEAQAVQPGDETSKAIVRKSSSIGSLNKTVSSSSGSTDSSPGGGSEGGGGNPGIPDTTPWPDTPPALICGSTSLLSGPSSAPAGAVVVPAGLNDVSGLEADNTTYWFAPGVHTFAPSPFAQIEPGNNSTYVGGPGAVLDGQGINNYAFTQHATNVKIQYLTIKNFVSPRDEGVVNHDSGVGWTIEYNTVQDNGGGAVFAGTDNIIRYNCLKDNGQYGFQVYSSDPGGPQNVILDHNEIVGNNTDDWEGQVAGCGCTGGGKFWEATNVTVTNNYVHHNLSVALWADTNDNDFLIENNYIEGNDGQGLFYEISYNMIVRNNNFIRNALVDGPGNPGFPTGAIYLSESGGDSRVPGRTASIDIYDNQFVDNWSGVILWENADRFCSSPSNTSTGTCTIVNPAANLASCTDPAAGGSVNVEPYYSDCRWKTQNVAVHDNVFSMDRAAMPDCRANNGCGFQGLFSNVGTFPTWSPYMGSKIQQAITFDQNNLFSNNTYLGDWKFKTFSQDTLLNFAIWQGTPYSQDVGSTFNGKGQLVVANALDDDTATLEGSIGEWRSWFSTVPTRSNEEAHSGSYSMKVELEAAFWGVNLADATGFPITPNAKTISFWGKLGSGVNQNAMLRLQWLDDDASHTVLQTNDLPLTSLTTGSWQEATMQVTPPAGAVTVNLQFLHTPGGSGTNGNWLYLDDIVIADND